MKRARKKEPCVVFNKARSTWNHLWFEGGRRHSLKLGTLAELPTKAHAVERAKQKKTEMRLQRQRSVPTIGELVEHYREEKMPTRYSTRRGYEVWLRCYIVPRWGDSPVTDVQARPVELWLGTLELAPKSKAEIRGIVRILWDFAMWREDLPTQRNPMELVTVRNSSKRTRIPRSLAVNEFQRLIEHLDEPFRTVALVCVCFGLRISECLALRWSDIDWLGARLRVERGIVRQRVDDVKTTYSQRRMSIDADMLLVLTRWKQSCQFSTNEDWVFASPVKLGRQPWSYDQVLRSFVSASEKAEIGKIGTHTMRHTYRSWLDAAGTPIAVQQKLMRHGDIRTTMNVYGDVVTDEMQQAHAKVVQMALTKGN